MQHVSKIAELVLLICALDLVPFRGCSDVVAGLHLAGGVAGRCLVVLFCELVGTSFACSVNASDGEKSVQTLQGGFLLTSLVS